MLNAFFPQTNVCKCNVMREGVLYLNKRLYSFTLRLFSPLPSARVLWKIFSWLCLGEIEDQSVWSLLADRIRVPDGCHFGSDHRDLTYTQRQLFIGNMASAIPIGSGIAWCGDGQMSKQLMWFTWTHTDFLNFIALRCTDYYHFSTI